MVLTSINWKINIFKVTIYMYIYWFLRTCLKVSKFIPIKFHQNLHFPVQAFSSKILIAEEYTVPLHVPSKIPTRFTRILTQFIQDIYRPLQNTSCTSFLINILHRCPCHFILSSFFVLTPPAGFASLPLPTVSRLSLSLLVPFTKEVQFLLLKWHSIIPGEEPLVKRLARVCSS